MRSWLIPFPPHAGATQARTAFHCRRGLAEARCGMRACPLQDQIHALNNSCCAVSSSTSPLARERNPAVGWQPCQRRACLWMEMEMKTKMEMGIKMGISCLPSPGAGAPSLSCVVLVASEVWTASFRCGDRLRELAPCTRSWALPDPAGPWPHHQITAFYSEQQTPLWDGHREPNLLPPPILTSPLRPIIAKCARSGGGSDDAWRVPLPLRRTVGWPWGDESPKMHIAIARNQAILHIKRVTAAQKNKTTPPRSGPAGGGSMARAGVHTRYSTGSPILVHGSHQRGWRDGGAGCYGYYRARGRLKV
jgi:hypothetical protein